MKKSKRLPIAYLIIDSPFLDRRRKLIPCQQEMARYKYEVEGWPVSRVWHLFRRQISYSAMYYYLKPFKRQDIHALGGPRIYYNSTVAIERKEKYEMHKYEITPLLTPSKAPWIPTNTSPIPALVKRKSKK